MIETLCTKIIILSNNLLSNDLFFVREKTSSPKNLFLKLVVTSLKKQEFEIKRIFGDPLAILILSEDIKKF